MPLSSDQQFVAVILTRENIAEWINQVIEDDNLLRVDDDRLTDEICQKFATAFGEIDGWDGEEAYAESIRCLSVQFAKELGLSLDPYAEEEANDKSGLV